MNEQERNEKKKAILAKIASKENARAGATVAMNLFLSNLSKDDKKKALSNFLYDNAETLDDTAELIPGYGPMLKALVDNPAADGIERQLCDLIAETIVQTLKGIGN